MKSFSCIIAFYNESKRIISVLDTLSNVKSISELICIDDGSTNNMLELVKQKHPKVIAIKLDKNKGKTVAVVEGLKISKNENTLLMDADLENLKANEIEKALQRFTDDTDMIILENKGGNTWIDPFINKNIFLSGQRILRKKDLEAVFKTKRPSGYQLEVAINSYIMDYNKKVYHIKTSSFNPHKIQKYGFINGMIKDIKMDMQIISYLGVRDYLKQLLTFGRKESD